MQKNWHSSSAEETLKAFDVSRIEGLEERTIEQRRAEYGPNLLTPAGRQNPFIRFLSQFNNILIYVLLVACAVTALLNHWIDAWVIFGVVLINALIGFIQEGKAEKAMEALKGLLSPQATVRRQGRTIQIDAKEIVPGDIVMLQSGDKVPADVRLVMAKDLRVDESLLTGESVPVEKNTMPAGPETPLADRTCMAFSGTLVTYGKAEGVVTATGDGTEIGRISSLLGKVETLQTPLLRRVEEFGRVLTIAIVALSVILFVFGVFIRDFGPAEMFNAAVGLAVAAIPEGLPAIMTITLAIGVQAMARRKSIIRRLPAVETLGSVSVICSDKTGTLTRNEMTVRSVALPGKQFSITGGGYDPHGAFVVDGQETELSRHPQMRALAHISLLCNDASLEQRDDQWVLSGDPTEGALVALGMKAGYDPSAEQKEWPRIDIIPFESEHRFMATLHHNHNGNAYIYLKGAPEVVLERCSMQRKGEKDEPLDLEYWNDRMQQMASGGERLLAIACRKVTTDMTALNFSDVESGMTLMGITGMIDPPREEAIEAVQRCQAAGIRVKMITGDHVDTAKAIGRMTGIGDGLHALTGPDIESMNDEELVDRVADVDIFARSSPEHKLRLVQALQARGNVVAMTGDGVNDAPALKRADVGIAMGQKGTEVSKEAAEMVLTDDNFATIANAVEQGRNVYDNLKKSILFVLPTNGGEALSILFAVLLGYTLPITAVQILWVNMVTAVTLALTLAFERPENDVMARTPRKADEPLLSRFIVWRIAYVSLILLAGTFGLFLWYEQAGHTHEMARTIAVNTLVLFEIFYLFSSRFFVRSVFSRDGFLGNRYVLYATGILVLLQGVFTYAPFMQHIFSTEPLEAGDWLLILLVSSSVLFLVELEKFFLRKKRSGRTGVS
ncbi:cation-transporting P-type ATPase [Prosthecochloris sp. HL-130-GSB]|uniref:cation-transporting P-type ATPase n=1 Tax=Prosthecochloris sp. HL-130-GSB TaxID=1974213 RepID=UPI000A1C0473|nr:cation-transporting P-type ATPase [Prosthecochloris sp. HL-130-GSB]ARM30922.1 carbonate dehydratase [Prosthecochloris sp. HL-130-GSB]